MIETLATARVFHRTNEVFKMENGYKMHPLDYENILGDSTNAKILVAKTEKAPSIVKMGKVIYESERHQII